MARKKFKRLQQPNRFKVPARQWDKWPDIAQRVFNDTYATYVNNQHLLVHPKAKPVTAEHWNTTAWNAAWIAAESTTQALEGITAQTGYA